VSRASILLAMVRDHRHPVSVYLREQLLAGGVTAASVGKIHEAIGFDLDLKHRRSLWDWAGPSRERAESAPHQADTVSLRGAQLFPPRKERAGRPSN